MPRGATQGKVFLIQNHTIMKQDNVPKLTFFSETILEKFQCQINNVQSLIIAERITYEQGHKMLGQAHKDLQTLYYRVSAKISKAENELTVLRRKGRFSGKQIAAPSILSLASQRAVVSLQSALRSYGDGQCTRRQLRRAKRLMMDCINSDIAALNQETADLIRKAKVPESGNSKEPEQTGEDWRQLTRDMTIRKVSTDAHDDLA